VQAVGAAFMRPALAYQAAAWLVFASLPTFATDVSSRLNKVTLLLQFEAPGSERVFEEIAYELQAVMKHAAISTELRLFSQLTPYQEFGNLVVVRMRGECRMDSRPVRRSDSGPLAFAHTSDGQVLPFMEVLCDRIRAVIRPVMWGDHFRHVDQLLGRAIGRVMAHELYHIIGQTSGHGGDGIAKHVLTGTQLIGDTLEFEPEDAERITSGAGGGG
jgi:hypothetical protein